MINIVCVKWGTKFSPDYVNNLYAGILRNTTVPFKFHCFTDDDSGLHQHIIPQYLPYKEVDSWWNKLYLFSDEVPIKANEQIVYMDLDTLIVKNIDELLSTRSPGLLILRDWFGGGTHVNSSIMSWVKGNHTHVWKDFIKDQTAAKQSVFDNRLIGDQGWVELKVPNRIYWQDVLPEYLVSYKQSCLLGCHPLAHIVCFHGEPSVVDAATVTNNVFGYPMLPQYWILEHWKNNS